MKGEMHFYKIFLCFFIIFLFCRNSFSREEGANARSLSLSDSIRSCAMGTSGIYFNPAGISQIIQYAIEMSYGYQNKFKSNAFNFSISDSQTNPNIGGGLAYTYLFSELKSEGRERSGHILRGALSSGIRSQDFSIFFGAGIKYINYDYGKEGEVSGFTFDAGAILNLWGQLSIAVVGQNLVDVSKTEAPTNLGLGLSFLYYPMLLSFDTVFDFKTKDKTKMSYNFGVELILKQILAFRGGFQINRIDENKKFSFGIGYISSYFGLDIGYLHNIDNTNEKIIIGALRFFLPSK